MDSDSVRDVWNLFRRANTKYMATPALPSISLFTPILLLTLFTQLFSGIEKAPGFPAGSYLQFALPGVMVMTVFSSSLYSGAFIVEDLESGYLAKILVTPVNRLAILLGRLLSDSVKTVLQTVIVLVLGYLMGANFATGAAGVALILVTMAFFGMAWSGISLAVGMATRSSEVVSTLPMVLTLPLMFTSTALVPLTFLPGWMQDVSVLNPVTYASDAIRALTSSGVAWNAILQDYIATALVALVGFAATMHNFRRIRGK